MIIRTNKKIVNEIFFGMVILITVTILGVILLELIVKKIKPQITFTQATQESYGIYTQNQYSSFTLLPDLNLQWMSTNSKGYRNREFGINKPSDAKRIIFLGDSFVFGGRVQRNDDALPQILEEILKITSSQKTEVINAGFKDGFSPDFYYSYLKGEGLSLKPDMVIIGIYLQNDIGDLKGNKWENLDKNGLPGKVESIWRKVDSKGRLSDGIAPLRYRYSILKDSQLWILLANWLDKNFPILRPNEEAKQIAEYNNWFYLTYSECIFKSDCFEKFRPEFDKLLISIKGINGLLTANNIPALFVFFPSRLQAGLDRNPPLSEEESYLVQNKITDYFKKLNIPVSFLDLTPDFLSINTVDYFNYQESHYNVLGNRKAAAVIAQKIKTMMGW